MGKVKVGVDVGGTFTDMVLFDQDRQQVQVAKIPSTPENPDQSVINGIVEVLSQNGFESKDITFLGHGTTIATNAIIERKGVKVGMITTAGFRDVLEMGRQKRPSVYDYNLDIFTPVFMVPRRQRQGIGERIDYQGRVLQELDLSMAEEILESFERDKVESVAVCLLFSFLNPAHEEKLHQLIRDKYPRFSVSLSSNVLPEFREYERFCATVFDAYVSPIMDRYLTRLEEELVQREVKAKLNIMQSNGGIMSAEVAKKRSVLTFLSGPSAGVMGAAFIGRAAGYDNLISLDMGGTSTDVSLIRNGVPNYTTDNDVDGYPLKIQVIDINAVGAGGGSIAWIDPGGALKNGPQSSGAYPGPVCYGQGGQEPTNTDVNLVLGYLSEESFLGGGMRIYKDQAEQAINDLIAKPLGMDLAEACAGIYEITSANMIGAIRKVSVLRGYDPRDYWLFAFGGSGPVYATKLAEEMKMKGVIVPPHPGVQSSFGILTVDYRYDLVRTKKLPLRQENIAAVNEIFQTLEKEGLELVAVEGHWGDVVFERSADMRYVGQAYEINVPLGGDLSEPGQADRIRADFHRIHKEVYKHCDERAPVEFINYRATASVLADKPEICRYDPSPAHNPQRALSGARQAYFKEAGGFIETPIYQRELLKCGESIQGPAIIEQMDSTTLVGQGQTAEVDSFLNLIIDLNRK
jgi:N-methylhydantoinase A